MKLKPLALTLALAFTLIASGVDAPALDKVTLGTNWVPQAEQGGYYQAVSDGTYKECGLDVTIVPGGPQVNNGALLMAGKLTFYISGNLLEEAKGSEPLNICYPFRQDHRRITFDTSQATVFRCRYPNPCHSTGQQSPSDLLCRQRLSGLFELGCRGSKAVELRRTRLCSNHQSRALARNTTGQGSARGERENPVGLIRR
jgi:hypothetical protein